MDVEEQEERELLAGFAGSINEVRTMFGPRLEKVEQDIRLVKQRGYRPPGMGDGAAAADAGFANTDALALRTNKELAAWFASPKTKQSAIAVEVPFRTRSRSLQTKAITGVGLTVPSGGLVGSRQPALRLAELIPDVAVNSGSAVVFTREASFTPAADIVPEAARKPESVLTFEDVVATFEVIATIIKISLQSLRDTPAMEDWVSQRLSYAVLLRMENYLLNAPVLGLMANATALDTAFVPPATGSTTLDFVGAAISQLEAKGYSPNGVVLAGPDAAGARLLKTADGVYLWSSPDAAIGTKAMWSVPVVISPSLTAGNFLVGDFAASSALFMREYLNVQISFENEDDFAKNMCTFRAEERGALSVMVPQGLVKGTLPAPVMAAANLGRK